MQCVHGADGAGFGIDDGQPAQVSALAQGVVEVLQPRAHALLESHRTDMGLDEQRCARGRRDGHPCETGHDASDAADLKRVGMTLRDPENEVRVAGHRGPHPEDYHSAVFERLTVATRGLSGDEYSAAFRAELSVIRVEVATPGTHFNRLVTGQ